MIMTVIFLGDRQPGTSKILAGIFWVSLLKLQEKCIFVIPTISLHFRRKQLSTKRCV